MSPTFRIAFRNLRRNWRHSLAALLSLTAGFMAICLFEGYIRDLRFQFEDGFLHRGMYGDLVVERHDAAAQYVDDPWSYNLTEQDQGVIDAFLEQEAAHIAHRVRFLNVTGMVSNGRTSTVFLGIGHDVLEGTALRGPQWAWNTTAGRPLHEVTLPDPVLIGGRLSELLDCELEQGVPVFRPEGGYLAEERPFRCPTETLQLQVTTERYQLNAVDAGVAGVVDAGLRELDDKYIAMPLETAWRLLDTRRVTMYSLALTDPSERDGLAARLEAFAKARGLQLDVMPWQRHPIHGALFRQSIELLSLFRTFVMAVVVVIGVMSVLNTLTKSVAERTREIGTLRSLGFLRRHIVAMFAWEGFLLALAACTVGLVLTLGLSLGLTLAGISYRPGVTTIPIPLRIQVIPLEYLVVAILLCLLSTVAAMIPASRAAASRITDALGHI